MCTGLGLTAFPFALLGVYFLSIKQGIGVELSEGPTTVIVGYVFVVYESVDKSLS